MRSSEEPGMEESSDGALDSEARTSTSQFDSFNFNEDIEGGSPYSSNPSVRFADGTAQPAQFPEPGTAVTGDEWDSSTAFSAAEANDTFSNNLAQSQFGETDINPS